MRRLTSFIAVAAVGAVAALPNSLPPARAQASDASEGASATEGLREQMDAKHSLGQGGGEQKWLEELSGMKGLANAPVTTLFPGDVKPRVDMRNPMAGDPGSARRGMTYFSQFNCAGCHAANGGGGMGPSLSNSKFIYGSKPGDIYLTIVQGRPNGMPSWGRMLPDKVVWDLVSYVESISKEPDKPWGKTTSKETLNVEQVPVEYLSTPSPWKYTQPFSSGQRPLKKTPQKHE
jgi:cytochrome c oxidase cbb3-type subunit 3